VVFAHAEAVGYVVNNPMARAMRPKVVEKPAGILTVSEAERLLRAADPEILPFIAIGLFAGLRDAELWRLSWNNVDLKEKLIHVPADKAKTAQRRIIPMRPNLHKWLTPDASKCVKAEPLCPSQSYKGRQLWEKSRKDAGFGKGTNEEGVALKVWPHNALRHSFASYHLAHFKDAARLALEMGHTHNNLIFKNYRELVTPKDAKPYWNIVP
jgi:integrase